MLLLYVFVSLAGIVVAYNNGAPQGACVSMTPGHGSLPQTLPSPYTLKAMNNGKTVNVMISAKPNDYFEGFFLQARNDKGAIVGTFKVPDASVKIVDCLDGKQNAVTHSTKEKKTNVTVVWTPAASSKDTVKFMLTSLRSFNQYWVNQTLLWSINQDDVPPVALLDSPMSTTASPKSKSHASAVTVSNAAFIIATFLIYRSF